MLPNQYNTDRSLLRRIAHIVDRYSSPVKTSHMRRGGFGRRGGKGGGATLTVAEVQAFVYDGIIVPVVSSNVLYAMYFIDSAKLVLEFTGSKNRSQSAYMYSGVNEEEAFSFIRAKSKGSWVWDYLRGRRWTWHHFKKVRTRNTGHIKTYMRIK